MAAEENPLSPWKLPRAAKVNSGETSSKFGGWWWCGGWWWGEGGKRSWTENRFLPSFGYMIFHHLCQQKWREKKSNATDTKASCNCRGSRRRDISSFVVCALDSEGKRNYRANEMDGKRIKIANSKACVERRQTIFIDNFFERFGGGRLQSL